MRWTAALLCASLALEPGISAAAPAMGGIPEGGAFRGNPSAGAASIAQNMGAWVRGLASAALPSQLRSVDLDQPDQHPSLVPFLLALQERSIPAESVQEAAEDTLRQAWKAATRTTRERARELLAAAYGQESLSNPTDIWLGLAAMKKWFPLYLEDNGEEAIPEDRDRPNPENIGRAIAHMLRRYWHSSADPQDLTDRMLERILEAQAGAAAAEAVLTPNGLSLQDLPGRSASAPSVRTILYNFLSSNLQAPQRTNVIESLFSDPASLRALGRADLGGIDLSRFADLRAPDREQERTALILALEDLGHDPNSFETLPPQTQIALLQQVLTARTQAPAQVLESASALASHFDNPPTPGRSGPGLWPAEIAQNARAAASPAPPQRRGLLPWRRSPLLQYALHMALSYIAASFAAYFYPSPMERQAWAVFREMLAIRPARYWIHLGLKAAVLIFVGIVAAMFLPFWLVTVAAVAVVFAIPVASVLVRNAMLYRAMREAERGMEPNWTRLGQRPLDAPAPPQREPAQEGPAVNEAMPSTQFFLPMIQLQARHLENPARYADRHARAVLKQAKSLMAVNSLGVLSGRRIASIGAPSELPTAYLSSLAEALVQQGARLRWQVIVYLYKGSGLIGQTGEVPPSGAARAFKIALSADGTAADIYMNVLLQIPSPEGGTPKPPPDPSTLFPAPGGTARWELAPRP